MHAGKAFNCEICGEMLCGLSRHKYRINKNVQVLNKHSNTLYAKIRQCLPPGAIPIISLPPSSRKILPLSLKGNLCSLLIRRNIPHGKCQSPPSVMEIQQWAVGFGVCSGTHGGTEHLIQSKDPQQLHSACSIEQNGARVRRVRPNELDRN